MNAPNGRAAVKVRWERGLVIGPWMPVDQALKLLADVEQAVLECGDGSGFVYLDGFDGREARIRGREVVTIECVPDLPARVGPPAAARDDRPAQTFAAGGTAVVSYPAHGVGHQPTTPATQFLRQQAARQLQANADRR